MNHTYLTLQFPMNTLPHNCISASYLAFLHNPYTSPAVKKLDLNIEMEKAKVK